MMKIFVIDMNENIWVIIKDFYLMNFIMKDSILMKCVVIDFYLIIVMNDNY